MKTKVGSPGPLPCPDDIRITYSSGWVCAETYKYPGTVCILAEDIVSFVADEEDGAISVFTKTAGTFTISGDVNNLLHYMELHSRTWRRQ